MHTHNTTATQAKSSTFREQLTVVEVEVEVPKIFFCVLRSLLQSTETHRPSHVKNSSPVRQTYGLYGTVVILRILGTRLEQHSSHNFGWLRAFVGSLSGGISGPSRFLPCLCGAEYNTNRRCYYMVVLLFRRAFVGRGAGASGHPNPYRPLIGTGP